jgi:hypothetical protein
MRSDLSKISRGESTRHQTAHPPRTFGLAVLVVREISGAIRAVIFPRPIVLSDYLPVWLAYQEFSSESRNPVDAGFPSRSDASVELVSCAERQFRRRALGAAKFAAA